MAEYIERELAEKEIFIKRDQERQHWMEYLDQRKGTKEYSSAEKSVDNWLRGYGEAVENILAIFDKLSADVEPVKHAAFVQDEEHWYICGNCHHATCSEFDLEGEYKKIEINGKVETIYALKQPNYCKHCGSKMDGKEVQE